MNQSDFRALLAQSGAAKKAPEPAPAEAPKAKPKFKPRAQRKEKKEDGDSKAEEPKYRDRAAERRNAVADEVEERILAIDYERWGRAAGSPGTSPSNTPRTPRAGQNF